MRNEIIKLPKPDVCDSCFSEGNLRWNDERQEWLCVQCNALLRNNKRMMDYENGKKYFGSDITEW